MAVLGLRIRAGYLLLAAVVGHVLLISAQVNTTRGVPMIEAVLFGAFSEVQRGTSGVADGIGHLWGNYIALRHVRADNDALRQQLVQTQIQMQEQRALADRSRNLEQILELRDRVALQTTAAEIIAAGATPDFRTVTIDKGLLQGLRADMAVIAPAGIVGRVVTPGPRAAKVQLLIDRNAAAGALIERSRAQGVVMGTGDRRLRMDYVAETADVRVGDAVVTSGIDGIYPKGLIVGYVDTAEKSGNMYREIVVRPAVDFNALEDVLVVMTPSPARDPASETPQ